MSRMNIVTDNTSQHIMCTYAHEMTTDSFVKPDDATMMQMHTFFYVGKSLTDFLFKGWTSHDSTGVFVLMCLTVVALAIIHEALRTLHLYIQIHAGHAPLERVVQNECEHRDDTRSALVKALLIPASLTQMKRRRILMHIAETVSHMIGVTVGLVIMLCVMTYNAWIAIAIFLGSGLGFFIFHAIQSLILFRKFSGTAKTISDRLTIETEVSPPTSSSTQDPSEQRLL